MTFQVPSSSDEVRVVAADEDVRHFQQRRGVTCVRCLALEAHLAVRPITFPGDFIRSACDIQRAHRHFADGECARFVGADNVRGAERFDGRQSSHKARRRDMRSTPSASAIVTTAGKLSGTAATARLTEVRNNSKNSDPRASPSTKSSATMPSDAQTSMRPNDSSFCWSGVPSSSPASLDERLRCGRFRSPSR